MPNHMYMMIGSSYLVVIVCLLLATRNFIVTAFASIVIIGIVMSSVGRATFDECTNELNLF